MEKKELKKYFAISFIVILAIFLGYASRRYIPAAFGALILFYLFNWLYKLLNKKLKLSKQVSAVIVIILSIIIIIVPSYFLISASVQEISIIIKENIDFNKLFALFNIVPEKGIMNAFVSELSSIGVYLQSLAFNSFNSISHLAISLTITYFILYYLFINNNEVEKKLMKLIPFNKKNSKVLIKEFKNVTYSTVITTGVIAILQGTLLGIGFYMFGLKGCIFWGIITAFLSILPVVGPPIIWIPAVIILFGQNNYLLGTGMLVWGLFLSNIDNFIRPYLQNKIGKIHPLITLLGIFIGLPTFGILGVIIGPLLLSYFLLSVNMFLEEYLDHNNTISVYIKNNKKEKKKKFGFLNKKKK